MAWRLINKSKNDCVELTDRLMIDMSLGVLCRILIATAQPLRFKSIFIFFSQFFDWAMNIFILFGRSTPFVSFLLLLFGLLVEMDALP